MNHSNARALLQQALGFINQNQLESAYKALIQADQLVPNNIEIYHLLSVVYGMSADYEQSEAYCKKALAINANAVIVINNMGSAQKLLGKYEKAENSFRSAIKIQNNYIDAYVNLANLLLEIENIDEAESLINTAMNIDRSNLPLNLALGNLRLKQENNKEAISIYQNILNSQPQNTDAIINLGQIFEHLGDTEKALKYYQDALQLIPGYDQSIIGIASIKEKQGEHEAALSIVTPALQSSQNIKLHIICGRLYSRLKDYVKAEQVLSAAKDLLSIEQHRQELLYELGDVLDKQARYDDAFAVYSQANQINRLEFDREESEKYFESIKNVFNLVTFENLASSDNHSKQPLFIVGMPRSGTSLVEQMLAGHSQIFGAGELEYIDEIIYQLNTSENDLNYPDWVNNLQSSALQQKADDYLKKINQLSADSTYITNKMPHNFLHLGLIQLLFPEAKIIHCTRNPKDTALSIFFHQFNKNHPYASDLSDLSFYYQQYEDLMAHWKNVLSLQMLTVNYEDLINDAEKECRKLIDFCELDWEESCLNFHTSKRLVNTPSYHQVKQPLYNSSVNRHNNYTKYISGVL